MHESIATSPQLASMPREASWPVEGFSELHISGSEPRIFPGVLSRTRRRPTGDSTMRQNSMSETDDQADHLKRYSKGKSLEDALEEESDSEMEEAGGMDEQ